VLGTSGVQISFPAFIISIKKGSVLTMCIAVPAEVIEIKDGNIGIVDYGDLRQEVRLDLVDVRVGEFVLVHVGFAIQKLSREEGLETRELFKQVYAAMEE
jgi:hydrogenase expression/formation protein HypC